MFWSSARTDGARPDGRSKSCRTPRKQPGRKKWQQAEESLPGLSLGPFLRFKSGTPSFPAISVSNWSSRAAAARSASDSSFRARFRGMLVSRYICEPLIEALGCESQL